MTMLAFTRRRVRARSEWRARGALAAILGSNSRRRVRHERFGEARGRVDQPRGIRALAPRRAVAAGERRGRPAGRSGAEARARASVGAAFDASAQSGADAARDAPGAGTDRFRRRGRASCRNPFAEPGCARRRVGEGTTREKLEAQAFNSGPDGRGSGRGDAGDRDLPTEGGRARPEAAAAALRGDGRRPDQNAAAGRRGCRPCRRRCDPTEGFGAAGRGHQRQEATSRPRRSPFAQGCASAAGLHPGWRGAAGGNGALRAAAGLGQCASGCGADRLAACGAAGFGFRHPAHGFAAAASDDGLLGALGRHPGRGGRKAGPGSSQNLRSAATRRNLPSPRPGPRARRLRSRRLRRRNRNRPRNLGEDSWAASRSPGRKRPRLLLRRRRATRSRAARRRCNPRPRPRRRRSRRRPRSSPRNPLAQAFGAIAGAAAPASSSGNWALQFPAPKSEAEAKAAAARLNARYAPALKGATIGVEKTEVNGQTTYALRVPGLSTADAAALCVRLRGRDCSAVK